MALILGYDVIGRADWPNVVPRVYLSGHRSLWRDTLGVTRFLVQGGVGAGAPGRMQERTDLAHDLLLPGTVSARVGVSHVVGTAGRVQVVGPGLSVDSKLVPWRDGSMNGQVGFRLSAACFVAERAAFALRATRALNLLGSASHRAELLPPQGGDGRWVTCLGATAGWRAKPLDLVLLGTVNAYIGDSKFPFPKHGRRVYTLALMKEFGRRQGFARISDGATD